MKKDRKKRWGLLGMIILLGGTLTGCETPPADGSRLPRYSDEEWHGNSDAADEDWEEYGDYFDDWDYDWDYESGYYEGAMGDTMESAFFDFRVDAADFVLSYAGYTPQEGYELLDVTVTLTNTFYEEIPMFNTDFQIQWGGEGDQDFRFGRSELALEESHVMPDDFILDRGETVQYHVIYEVPAGGEVFSLSYLEQFSDGSEGSLYFVYFEPGSRLL